MNFFNFITQAVGILGIIASVISFQCKEHKNIMLFRTINEMLFAVQYCMLGAYTGMAMNLVGSTRNIIFSEFVKNGKDTKLLRLLFSAAFLIFAFLTQAGLKSFLIGAAKIGSTVAYGSKNTTFVRIMILLTSSAWLMYNFFVKSYAGCLCEMFTIVSIIAGIIRFDILKTAE